MVSTCWGIGDRCGVGLPRLLEHVTHGVNDLDAVISNRIVRRRDHHPNDLYMMRLYCCMRRSHKALTILLYRSQGSEKTHAEHDGRKLDRPSADVTSKLDYAKPSLCSEASRAIRHVRAAIEAPGGCDGGLEAHDLARKEARRGLFRPDFFSSQQRQAAMSSSEDLPLVAELEARIALNTEMSGDSAHRNIAPASEGDDGINDEVDGAVSAINQHIDGAVPARVEQISEQGKRIRGAEAEAIAASLHEHRATVHTLIINSKSLRHQIKRIAFDRKQNADSLIQLS